MREQRISLLDSCPFALLGYVDGDEERPNAEIISTHRTLELAQQAAKDYERESERIEKEMTEEGLLMGEDGNDDPRLTISRIVKIETIEVF